MLRALLLPLFAALLFAGGSARADITIGVAGPMTGAFAVLGMEMQTGAAQAIADINKAGGVNGQMLHLEAVNDACDAKTADAVANQLTGKGALLVVGHVCLAASAAGAAVYARNKIVEISPATTYPEFTDKRIGPGVFRLAERDDQQGAAIGMFLAARFGTKNIALLNDDSEYGRALTDDVRGALNTAGKKEAMTLVYTANATDFSDVVGKLKAAMVDAVFIGGSDTDAAGILKQMRASGLSAQVVGGDAIATNQFWQLAGASAEGTLMTLPFDPRKGGDATAVVKAFRDMGVEPEGYVLPSYAAVTLWAAAAAKAGTTDFDKVVAALDAGSFPSVLGPVNFSKTGDANLPGFVLYQWHNGRFDTYSPEMSALRNLLTDVAGLRVGNAEDARLKSGVTVVVCDEPAVGSVHVMGGAPGTRETDLLQPEFLIEAVDAVVLSGGSAFGLDAASGVVAALAREGRGYRVGPAAVPIVPAAILFDLLNGGDKAWGDNTPYPRLGAAAYASAGTAFALGTAGAGTGATTAELKGGLGSASTRLQNGVTVAALAAVNAAGAATVGADGHFWAAPFEVDSEFCGRGLPHPLPRDAGRLRLKGLASPGRPGESTTLVVVATDARLTKRDAKRVATMAHDGFARALYPVHTPVDGDIVFSLATGRSPVIIGAVELIALGTAAATCVARAIARGVYEATPAPADLLPTWRQRFGG